MTNMTPVILSGGVGTRLWPLSRESFPKQFHAVLSDKSLLQETVARTRGPGFNDTLVVCANALRFIVGAQLDQMGVKPAEILLEPMRRNTGPAAVIAALRLQEQDPDALMLLLPADHFIKDTDAFLKALSAGKEAALAGAFVTFGIEVRGPETGYGYIHAGTSYLDMPSCLKIMSFKEKPDAITAQSYIDQGGFYWNSGIYLFPVTPFLKEIEALNPELVRHCRETLNNAVQDQDYVRLDEKSFEACPSISIDVAFMERTDNAVVVPVEMGWTDVGNWDAFWEAHEKDENGNAVQGDVMLEDTSDSLVYTTGDKLIATIGVSDLVVVDTNDCVLIASRGRSQDISRFVERLRKVGNRTEHLTHLRTFRPWGWYEQVDRGDRFQVKRIQVKPGGCLSMQMHYHRAEHWIIVSGTALITRGEETFLLHENESTFIPIGCTHRLENPGQLPLNIIEVQSGAYLGEDDIVRMDDVYGREND